MSASSVMEAYIWVRVSFMPKHCSLSFALAASTKIHRLSYEYGIQRCVRTGILKLRRQQKGGHEQLPASSSRSMVVLALPFALSSAAAW